MIIGQSHLVCQDYAKTMHEHGASWAFVSDGCSSSSDTDIGSRLVVLMAMQAVRKGVLPNDPAMLLLAHNMAAQLGMHQHCLDATLLAVRASVTYGGFDFFLAGDGAFGVRKADGSMIFSEIKYENNQPYYMNYDMCAERKMNFAPKQGKLIHSRRDKQGKWESIGQECWKDKDATFWPAEKGDIAFVMTDGVFSVTKKNTTGTSVTTSPVQTDMVIDRLVDFKAVQGQFVSRRLNFFKKEMALMGWSNYDDLAIGAVSMEVKDERKGGEQDGKPE